MSEAPSYTVQPLEYRTAISEEKDFYIQFHRVSREADAIIYKVIHRYLSKYDIVFLKEAILNILKELINNGIKANLKRLYFKMNNLDIENSDDYRQGMENFKDEVYQGDDEHFDKLYESKLVVRLSFKATEKYIHISVINNVPILDAELKKIQARVKKAYRYQDISEAFEDVLDDSEGAGLGLIMAMMLYKNSGFPAESFKIYRKDEFTIATLNIPKEFILPESKKEIANEILKEIEDIPAFPDNIREIQRQCNNPDSSMKDIAESISRDPGLTTSILKLANSASYYTTQKVESIEDGAKIIGIKGINTLLVAVGVYKILESKYKKFESIWKDSYKRAFYAQKIAIQIKRSKMSDLCYLAGLLSDVGSIILLSITPAELKRLRDIADTNVLDDSSLLEELTVGVSHSTLGAMVCEKWKFPDILLQTIEYHHRPHVAPEDIKLLVYTVYMADQLVEIEKRKSFFGFIDEDVLSIFKLDKQDTFEAFHKTLKEDYENLSANVQMN